MNSTHKSYKKVAYIRMANEEVKTSKTVIYCRTASTHPNDCMEIFSQRDKLRQFAYDQGYGICEEYLDDGYSGNNLDRPAFAKMESDMAMGKIDTIIVSCVDRIARDHFIREDWLHQLGLMGIRIIAIDGSHEASPLLQQIHKETLNAISSKNQTAV